MLADVDSFPRVNLSGWENYIYVGDYQRVMGKLAPECLIRSQFYLLGTQYLRIHIWGNVAGHCLNIPNDVCYHHDPNGLQHYIHFRGQYVSINHSFPADFFQFRAFLSHGGSPVVTVWLFQYKVIVAHDDWRKKIAAWLRKPPYIEYRWLYTIDSIS